MASPFRLPLIVCALFVLAGCAPTVGTAPAGAPPAEPLPSYRQIRAKQADFSLTSAQRSAHLDDLKGLRLVDWVGVVKDVKAPGTLAREAYTVILESETTDDSFSVYADASKDQALGIHKGDRYRVSGTVGAAFCPSCFLLESEPDIDTKMKILGLSLESATLQPAGSEASGTPAHQ